MAKLYHTMIRKKLTAPIAKVNNLARANAARVFESRKRQFIETVDRHPVSEELNDSASKDESDFLGGRSGNLRAFIGFYPNDDPVGQIKEIILQRTRLSHTKPSRVVHGTTIIYGYTILYPTLKELYEQTPYPQPGPSGSWLRGIEKGVPGLTRFFFSNKVDLSKWSKSGSAIQAKRIIRAQPTRMKGVNYITDLLRSLRNRTQGRL